MQTQENSPPAKTSLVVRPLASVITPLDCFALATGLHRHLVLSFRYRRGRKRSSWEEPKERMHNKPGDFTNVPDMCLHAIMSGL